MEAKSATHGTKNGLELTKNRNRWRWVAGQDWNEPNRLLIGFSEIFSN